ncbi:MAG TPA: PilN domain-containing protein [Vicinamibacterales bacterium]|nr:PilN domain-containing protein [Vicinamibacterales bacterium]
MIRINLLPTERKKKKAAGGGAASTGQKMVVACTLIIVGALGFIGWRYATLTRQSSQLDADLQAAQQETTRLRSIIQQVQQFEQRKTQLQQRVLLIEQLRAGQTGPVHMLDQISRSLPQMLWLTRINQDPKDQSIVIDGLSTTQNGVTEFVNNLAATQYFRRDIEIVQSQAQPIPQPPGLLYRFQVKTFFLTPAAPAVKPASGTTSAKTSG